MKIEIYSVSTLPISHERATRIVSRVLKTLQKPLRGELSLAFVSDRHMRRLNSEWLGRKGSTDILSFPGEKDFLGEIIINRELVQKKEIPRLLVHGLLSLYGFDHKGKNAKKMLKLEEDIFQKIAHLW